MKIRIGIFFLFVGVLAKCSVAQNDSIRFLELLNKYPLSASIEKKRDFVRELYDSIKDSGNHQRTYYFLKTASRFFKEKNEVLTYGATLNYLGLFYNNIGKYNDAIQSFSSGISLLEEYKKKNENTNETHLVLYLIYLNYGNTFYFLDEPNKALVYYKKALFELKNKTNLDHSDSLKIAQVFNNFGITYSLKKDNETGRYYFKKALEINTQLRDSIRIANVLSNLASLHSNENEMDSALSKYFVVKQIYEKTKNKTDIGFINGQIASVYLDMNNPKTALSYALVSLQYCDTTAYSHELVSTYDVLNKIYGKLLDYKNEVKFLRLYTAVSDSVNQEETINEINRKELLLQFNTLHVTDSIKAAEELKRKDLSVQANKRQNYFLIIVLLLTFVALGLIYSRFKITKKQKSIIEIQKGIVDDKNKEITDSINYAKRIQNSLLPTEKYIEKTIKRLNKKST